MLEEEIQEEEACLSLPFALVMLVSFAAVAIGHLEPSRSNNLERAAEFDVTENANFAFVHPFGQN